LQTGGLLRTVLADCFFAGSSWLATGSWLLLDGYSWLAAAGWLQLAGRGQRAAAGWLAGWLQLAGCN